MKSKDSQLLAEAYSKVLKEQSGFSIGNELYKLYTELEPSAKTKSGARVSDVLKSILEELNDVVQSAQNNADQPEVLHTLLKRLALD